MNWRRFWNRKQRDEELAGELDLHLLHEIDDNLAAGMSPDRARLAAIRKLGNRTQFREDVYRMNTIGWLESLLRDARYALRGFRRSPGFTAVALLSLMLGIGATTAIFSVFYGMVIHPYPYAKPDEIWSPRILQNLTGDGYSFYRRNELPELRKLPVFADVMANTDQESMLLTGKHAPESLDVVLLTGNAFRFLGVKPLIGRTIEPFDILPNGEAAPVVVLSYQVWQRLFDGAPEAVGEQLVLDSQPHTVIGVMPARFTWGAGDGVWLPLPEGPSDDRLAFPFMRLTAGVSAEAAEEQLQALSLRLAEIAPHHFPKDGFTISMRNYMDSIRSGSLQGSLRLLLCAVGFLLLIACANVANLQLARSTARSREIAVRLSIGAGRRRLLRQLLTESILLSLLGGALGVLFALAATHVVVTLMPGDYLINAARITVNVYVLLFSLGVSVATGILFGLAPALQSSRPDLTDALKEAARGSGFSRAGRRTRSALVIAEVALSMVLLVGAGLTIRSFSALLDVDPGFQPERLLMVDLPRQTRQPTTLGQHNLSVRQVLDEVRILPGVEAAAIGPAAPNTGAFSPYTIEGLPHAERLSVGLISAGYMRTVGVPLLRGRVMTEQEVERADPVALINERAAALWPRGEDPIGKRLSIDALAGLSSDVIASKAGGGPLTVIGIVGDTKNNGQQRETRPAAFVPYTMLAKTGRTLVLRTRGEPELVLNSLRERIQAIDPQQAVGWTSTGERMLGLQAVQPRFTMAILCFFGAVGLVLAVAGVYSVLSYQVTQRTHEIGVRLALGAHPGSVRGLLLRLGGKLIFAGLAIGIAASLTLGRFFESQLFGVTPRDPLSIGVVALLLAAVALLSAYIPARRASRVDPLAALRHE